ncbi:autotransporter outer membrane beta-barrel domain-containing protein [Rhodopirellula sp. P2]|uniref:autotransporter outer membrane beta-barrel domain-containing protein n=1 Tax=Rhodopirellula sp. P2 TaxID=2127060 RepID=UPI00236840FE|nr:autotransporter outer membrane beta-barrel domain-containing protein [Rhodopirellula sp. P2]WDQ16393.1 autotransporter domain-containing protein [Rhodopirellula sp. P2]
MPKFSPGLSRRQQPNCRRLSPRRAQLRRLLGETWRSSRNGIAAMLLAGVAMVGPTWAATIDVADEAEFNTAITNSVAGDTIRLTAGITLTGNLNNLDKDLTIDGNGQTLSGNSLYRPFLVESGTVVIENLTIEDGKGQGGGGGYGAGGGGGGGMGAGGAVFVDENASVTLRDVSFQNNSATGGTGGPTQWDWGGGGGGGYLTSGAGATGSFDGIGGAGGAGGGGDGGDRNANGSNGGFGGGGGGKGFGGTVSGSGGFGGGGSASGSGGIYGGDGGFGGGGGAGLGGAVFVREGGTLTLEETGLGANSGFSGGMAVGGAGSSTGQAGQGIGTGLFLNDVQATVNVANGQAMTIADTIGGNAGGGIVKSGDGTLTLSGANSYTGGTTVSAGTLIGNTTSLQGNIANNASVQFNQAADGTYAGVVSGTGSLTKSGSEALTLSGVNTFTGTTTVSAGRLSINGSTTSETTVAAGAELGGSGTITGNVINNGTLAAGNSIGTLNVTGNYTAADNSTMVVEIQPSAAPVAGTDNDLVAVTGTANVSSTGTTVQVDGTAGTYTHNSQYTFLTTTGGLTGTFGSITDNLAFFDAALGYTANNAFFTLIENSSDYASVAGTGNQRSVAAAIDRNSAGATGDFRDLLDEFRPMTNAQVQNGLSQLGASVNGSSQQVGIQGTSQLFGVLSGQLRGSMSPGLGASGFSGGSGGFASAQRTGNSRPSSSPVADSAIALVSYQESSGGLAGPSYDGACDSLGCARRSPSWLGWTTGYGLGGSAQSDGNADGIHYGLGGVTFGIEKFVDDCTRIGFFGGYVGSQVTTDNTNQTRKSNGGNFGMLLTHASGIHYGMAIGGFQFDGISSERNMQIGALSATADGETEGWQTFAYGERGMNLQLTDSVLVRPFAGLQYVYARQNGFTETGAGAMNLAVDGNDTHSLRSLLGGELEFATRPLRGMGITPQLRAIYMHEFLDSNTLVNSQFAGVGGSGFSSEGLDLGRDWGIVGGGLVTQLTDQWSLRGDYNAQFNEHQVHHVGSGTLSYVW